MHNTKSCLRLIYCAIALAIASIGIVRTAAAATTYGIYTVTSYSVLAEYGGGDVVVEVQSPPSTCVGFWLRPSDPGFKALFASIVLAYSGKTPLEIRSYDDSLWSGSGGAYCRVYLAAPR